MPGPLTDRFGKPLPSDNIHKQALERLRFLEDQTIRGGGPAPMSSPLSLPQTPPPTQFQVPPRPVTPLRSMYPSVPKPPAGWESLVSLPESGIPSAYDPTKSAPGTGVNDGQGWGDRPQLNTPAALAGLKEASSQFQGPPRISTEELYKQSFRDPSTMAPGAGQYAKNQLEDRVGAEDFARLLGQKEQETVRTAEAGLHPAVQAEQERTARRTAYPEQEAGKASTLASMFGLQREEARGSATVEAARARRDQAAAAAIPRAMTELSIGPEDEGDDDREIRLNLLKRLDAMERAIRTGEYFLSDYADLDPFAAAVINSYIDETDFETGF